MHFKTEILLPSAAVILPSAAISCAYGSVISSLRSGDIAILSFPPHSCRIRTKTV